MMHTANLNWVATAGTDPDMNEEGGWLRFLVRFFTYIYIMNMYLPLEFNVGLAS